MALLKQKIIILLLIIIGYNTSCKNSDNGERGLSYLTLSIKPGETKISFPLDDESFPTSTAFNFKQYKTESYLAFSDNMNNSVLVYNFKSRGLVKKIHLQRSFKAFSAYFQNFDSIFIITNKSIWLIDSSGAFLKNINSEAGSSVLPVQIYAGNSAPPYFTDTALYVAAYPDLVDSKIEDMQRWRVLLKTSFQKTKDEVLLALPDVYRKSLFGANFLFPSYCVNNKHELVFSFAADPTIYVYDLKNKPKDYFGQSRYLSLVIPPVKTAKALEGSEETAKTYLLRDSYGAIYYDPYTKRYLRVAQKKLDEKTYLSKKWTKEHSLIIFDDNFQIIGESPVPKNINLNTLFITPSGIFVRDDAVKDENNLHFIKMEYEKLN